jgi:hypothetical protein
MTSPVAKTWQRSLKARLISMMAATPVQCKGAIVQIP